MTPSHSKIRPVVATVWAVHSEITYYKEEVTWWYLRRGRWQRGNCNDDDDDSDGDDDSKDYDNDDVEDYYDY